jgi:hypothetical protein
MENSFFNNDKGIKKQQDGSMTAASYLRGWLLFSLAMGFCSV